MNLNKFYGFVAEWLTNNENHEFGGQVGRPVEGQEISITRGCDVAHQKIPAPNSKHSSKKPGSVDFSGQFIHFRSLTGAVVGWETKPHMIPRCQERINWFCVYTRYDVYCLTV